MWRNDVSTSNQREIKECLTFLLEPLIMKNDTTYSFGFCKALVEKMKNHGDAIQPDDENTNYVSYCIIIVNDPH
jgi:sister-chromatid-cohesion protein PDS5